MFNNKAADIKEEMVEREKSFDHFPELPWELSEMIEKEMDVDVRCRFAGSSKRYRVEARSLKTYMHSLSFIYRYEDLIEIAVVHDQEEELRYRLQFKEGDGIKEIIYYDNHNQEKWRTKLSDSETILEHAIGKFKELLETWQKTIKKLELTSNIVGNGIRFNAETTNFKNLEELSIDGNFDCNEFLPKINRALKKLKIVNEGSNQLPMDEINQVRDDLEIRNLRLNNEQFLELTASSIYMNIGVITEEEVFDFIETWQNGAGDRKMSSIYWTLMVDSFDVSKLLLLLGDFRYISGIHRCYILHIKHNKEEGKRAELFVLGNRLQLCFYDLRMVDDEN